MLDNHVKTTEPCARFDEKALRVYKLEEVVLLSYSCELECRFHIHDVTLAPFDKALLKCPAAVQVILYPWLLINTLTITSFHMGAHHANGSLIELEE